MSKKAYLASPFELRRIEGKIENLSKPSRSNFIDKKR